MKMVVSKGSKDMRRIWDWCRSDKQTNKFNSIKVGRTEDLYNFSEC